MRYNECDKQWFNTYLSFEEKIAYLEELKEKLLVLEEFGILYSDIKDDNFLINSATGELKFCDVDNVQIDGLRVDTTQVISRSLRDENNLFDNSVHAFMHNIYTLEQLANIDIYTMDDLVELVENPRQGLIIFNKNKEQIIKNMVLVKKKNVSNRYLIDNLK